MPRIPDYDVVGTSVARANTPRFADRSRQIEAEGQQALLGAVGNVVQDISEHDDKMRYAAARSTLLQAQMGIRKELEADNDYETFEQRYRDRIGKAQAEAAKNIRGRRSRALFETDAQIDLERGAEQIRGAARAKEVNQGIALLNGTLETNRSAALESKDEAERIALLQSSNDLIQGAFDKGYISAEQAREVRTKFTTNYAEAFVGIQEPKKRIEMLLDPDSNFSKYIAPDRRKALLEAAKRENNDVRVRAESQAAEDGITEEFGTDFRAALAAARDIKDPEVRDSTVSRIKARQVEAKQFEIEDREAAGEEALAFLNGGGKYADLPITVKNRLKPSALNSLRAYAEAGTKTVTAPETLIQLSSLSADDPQAFGELNMLDYRGNLSDQDFEEFVDLQRKIRTGQLDGKATGFQSITQVRDAKLRELFPGTQKGANQAKINDFVMKFEGQLKAFKQDNGRAARAEDARKILDDLTAEVATGGFFNSTKAAYQLTDEDTQVPQQYRDAIVSELRRRGKPVTVEAIRTVYQKAIAPPPPPPKRFDEQDPYPGMSIWEPRYPSAADALADSDPNTLPPLPR